MLVNRWVAIKINMSPKKIHLDAEDQCNRICCEFTKSIIHTVNLTYIQHIHKHRQTAYESTVMIYQGTPDEAWYNMHTHMYRQK